MRRMPGVLAASTTGVALAILGACVPVPPPSEDYFASDVSGVLVYAFRRCEATGATDGAPRRLLFTAGSIPPAHQGIEDALRRELDRAGIAWARADSLGGLEQPLDGNRGGERGGASAARHTDWLLMLSVQGDGEVREVSWSFECVSGCGRCPGRKRFEWTGDLWN